MDIDRATDESERGDHTTCNADGGIGNIGDHRSERLA
jgi:hypothetical protein